jgi:predicted acetyltransferase
VRRELGPNLLRIPTFTVLVGYVADEPVATSLLATTADVGLAGVYSVATRPLHRGRGFGTALTRAALLEARASGYDTAVLEPSPMGAPMYRRMGFEPFASYLEAVG